jgi:D-alanyl-lipoteichoic acid acyltransferase DltB (MBOAT superfamily)
MLFNSQFFVFLFLPLTLLGFFLLGARGWTRMAIGWLVLASSVFYGWFKSEYLALLAILIVFNYVLGVKLARDRMAGHQRPAVLAAAIAVNLGVLCYYKYTNFILDNVNAAFGTDFVFYKVLLPLGISFFTFQKIAYLVDAYRGEAEEYNFLDFSLFVMFFPQLIAGPIVHHKEIIPQFRRASIFQLNPLDLAAGLTMFTIGLFKKVVIADTLATWVVPVFGAAGKGWPLSFLEAWSGALAFTFQIYFDFSAYSDMALGLALMIGIRLPLNFNSPYKAENVIEFWRRWHMTLSRFLRDYVYIPLGGNRQGQVRRYVNLLATMLLGGLWHGAAWTYVVWGGLHGVYLVINHGWHALRRTLGLMPGSGSRYGSATAMLVTFLSVVVAWVFFRAESFGGALLMLKGMAGLNGFVLPIGYEANLGVLGSVLKGWGVRFDDVVVAYWKGLYETAWLAVLLVIVWLLPNTQQFLARFHPAVQPVTPLTPSLFEFQVRPIYGAIVGGLLCGLIIYQSYRSATLVKFIYFQF